MLKRKATHSMCMFNTKKGYKTGKFEYIKSLAWRLVYLQIKTILSRTNNA